MVLRALAALFSSLALGCAASPTELEARLIELELRQTRLEAHLAALPGLEARLRGAETALARTAPDGELPAQLAALEARVLELEQSLAELRRTPRSIELGAPPPPTGEGPKILPGPRGPGAVLVAPPPGETVELVAVGAGNLLLVRAGQSLVKVELRGVVVPPRADEGEPALRERCTQAWGADALQGDRAFQASLERLQQLLGGRPVRLEYPESGAAPGAGGASLSAYVRSAGEGQDGGQDVGAAMIAAGFALASGQHERQADYARLETEARAARRGLFAPR